MEGLMHCLSRVFPFYPGRRGKGDEASKSGIKGNTSKTTIKYFGQA